MALGVTVITGVGAVSDALRASFERQGEAMLGGDVTLSRPHVRPRASERAGVEQSGGVSETATMRTMARRPDGTEQALVELKGVDAAYPLVGTVGARGRQAAAGARCARGAVVDPTLLERLALKVGDRSSLGTEQVPIARHAEVRARRASPTA